ncbi:MAG: GxxExxY protein [Phycisphaerae bacterium]|nr:GxxExxY protein [Phycisphaerae bacterium]MBM92231.1 GxxExxY protein [Phycisphaerae bacterium]HCT44189.1 GxxExxY protein [Phycisphaerales bacterium]
MSTGFRKHDLPDHIEQLAHDVIGAAIEVQLELGPGLQESLYEQALLHELNLRNIHAQSQAEIATIKGPRIDLLIENTIVVELKSIAQITDIHKAQLLSYLRAGRFPLGLLINFNTKLLRDATHRVLNERAIPASREPASSPSRSSRSNQSTSCRDPKTQPTAMVGNA